MTTDTDTNLMQRCRAILIERAKNGLAPMSCLDMAKLLGEHSPDCFRAMHAVPGVIIDNTARPLTKFSVPNA